jgi:hypothetical protein
MAGTGLPFCSPVWVHEPGGGGFIPVSRRELLDCWEVRLPRSVHSSRRVSPVLKKSLPIPIFMLEPLQF